MALTEWSWWRAARRGEFGPIHEDQPETGYYRTRKKGGKWLPVAIWTDGKSGSKVALVDGKTADAGAVWTWCCRYPVSYEEYMEVSNGGRWHDEINEEPRAGAREGSNAPSPFDELIDELDALAKAYQAWLGEIGGPITTNEQADKAATFKARFTEVEKKADDLRKVEKLPHFEAGKAVDAKWKAPIDQAGTWKGDVTHRLTLFLKEEKARIAEFAKSAEKEFGGPVEVGPVKVKGAVGKAVSLKSRKVAKIVDRKAAAMFFADRAAPIPEFDEVILKLARRLIAAGIDVPGVTEEIEESAA